MPPEIRRKIGSAKKRIEATPEIVKKEMGWFRAKVGELNPSALRRFAHKLIERNPNASERTSIHTHTKIDKGKWYWSYGSYSAPSERDVSNIFSDLKHNKIRNWHVVSINKKGEVVGYFSMHATKKLAKIAKKEKSKTLVDFIFDEIVRLQHLHTHTGYADSVEHMNWMRNKTLARLRSVGCIVKVRPMPGYKFEDGKFIKK